MKRSIKRQIATTFIGLVVAIMLISTLINSQFLGQYYVYYKQSILIDVYEKMQQAVENNGSSYENMAEELSEVVEVENIAFVIMSGSGQHLITSTSNERQTEEMRSQLMGYLLNINQAKGELLKQKENYQVRSTMDVMDGDEYIEMWGYLKDGSTFILRTPLESIRESVALSNRFFIYITLAMALLGCVFVWYFSKQIANPILQKDIEKKEKMESMRVEFIGNVSHELKTPIALIQGYAEGLREGILDDPESRAFYCDVIIDEAAKMNKMVQNLLTLNQLEVGQEEVSFERFNVMELIQGVVQSCEILIQQKEADVRLNGTEAVYVWADEWKVEQVFRNYFSNALHHLDFEKVIDIRVTVDEEKGTARISVFNTGKQIPEEDIDQIWNKFYKVDKARTREYGGNGIGLSIVKAIMDSLQKEYGVKNYNNGVQFWFELDVR